MKKYFFMSLLSFAAWVNAQEENSVEQKSLKPLKGNSTTDSVQIYKTTIEDYKFWTENSKPMVIDTTLSVNNYYNQNFTKQDLFGKMLFPNSGSVVVDLERQDTPFGFSMLPTGKKYNYYAANQIKYYNVKTPYTEFIYEAGVKEGNFLSTTFSQNLGARFNYTLHYRGLNSEGRFAREANRNNSFIISSNYRSKNNRFKLEGHWAAQNFDTQENGGVADIYDFILQDERRLSNVRNIKVNLNNARSEFDARRFFLTGSYGILKRINSKDSSVYHPIELKNTISYEKQKLRFEQSTPEYFDSPVIGNDARDKKYATIFSNVTTAGFNWTERVKLEAGVKLQNISVGVDQLITNTDTTITYQAVPKKWSESFVGAVGKLTFDWNERLKLRANAEILQGNHYNGLYNVDAALDISPVKNYKLTAGILAQANMPSLNMVYNQSYYADYNYFNEFSKENVQKLYGILDLSKFNTTLEASIYNIKNHVYIDTDYKPKQLNENINYYKLKLTNHLQFAKNFNLVSTLQYQDVTKNEKYMPLPDLIWRETFYWQGAVFEGKAEVQAGINAYYFSKYNAMQYFPVNNEFMLQNGEQIQKVGGFPIVDLFLNFKVKNMRFYIRGEHINAMFTKDPNYFSAPGVPYRAFKFQLGLKWNIFT